MYYKLTYTELHLSAKSFMSYSYKESLIKCLIDRLFKICNKWNYFHNDIERLKFNLTKDMEKDSHKVLRNIVTKLLAFLQTLDPFFLYS